MTAGRSALVDFDLVTRELVLLDVRALPAAVSFRRASTPDEVARAIREGLVCGAGTTALALAYALVLQAQRELGDARSFLIANGVASRLLAALAPETPEVGRAVGRMAHAAGRVAQHDPAARAAALLAEVEQLHRAEVARALEVARQGASLLEDGATVLIGAAGALTMGGSGDALAAVRAAVQAGKQLRVLVAGRDEGARAAALCGWELAEAEVAIQFIPSGELERQLSGPEPRALLLTGSTLGLDGAVTSESGGGALAGLARELELKVFVSADERLVVDALADRHAAGEMRGADLLAAPLLSAVFTAHGSFCPRTGSLPPWLLQMASPDQRSS